MAGKGIPLAALPGAETVVAHGKAYALVPATEMGLEVYRVEDGLATKFGGSVTREGALRLVDDNASGRAQARADRFQAYLGRQVDAVRADVAGPVRAAGFDAWHMGGGCMAWGKNQDDGSHVLVTTEDNEIDFDPAAPAWVVGRYDAEEGFVFLQAPTSLADALANVDRLPAPVRGFEILADDVEDAVASVEAAEAAPAP